LPSDRLFGPSLTTPAVAAAVSEEAWLGAMLEVESALAASQADAGLVPVQAAAAIAAVCQHPERFDLAVLGEEAAAAANPVEPLVRALSAKVPEGAAQFVHWGATSQDVLDTAMMLVSRRALDLVLDDLQRLADACAILADRHRSTLMAGRTLLQHALPITFGLKAAGWLSGALAARQQLSAIRTRRLAVQFGGAAGTLASQGDRGLQVLGGLARHLDLAEPVLPWHAERSRVAELGAALAVAAGAAGKVALDVALLTQTEVREVAEVAPGTSSAMPHKRNPVAAIEIDAAARGVQAQTALLLGVMRAEHERAAGAWQAEWTALSEAFRLADGAVARAAQMVGRLEVDEARMRGNLDLSGGLVMSESVTMALAPALGRTRARGLVQAAIRRASGRGSTFANELAGDPEVSKHLDPEALAAALDPARYLGSTQALIERSLTQYRTVFPSALREG
jgi:3-carboxy-cis,cis-muconate cycloisomerase